MLEYRILYKDLYTTLSVSKYKLRQDVDHIISYEKF